MSRKKVCLIYILILTGILFLFLECDMPSSMKKLYFSKQELQECGRSHSTVSMPLCTSIFFDEQELIYDAQEDTFFYSVVPDSIATINPTIELDLSDEASVEKVQVAFKGDSISNELIASSRPISLITYDSKNMHVSKLIVTTLPVMNIVLDDGGKVEADDYLIEEPIAGAVYMYDNRADFDKSKDKLRTFSSKCTINTRGQTSRAWVQKGYSLKLFDKSMKKNKAKLLGIREDDDWILTSAYLDYDKVRNVFASNLWRQSFSGDNEWQCENSVEYQFIELFINGQYRGLYALSDRFDQKQSQVNPDDGEYLFKKKDWSMSEYNEVLDENEVTGEKYLAGYFLQAGGDEGFEVLHNLYRQMVTSADTSAIRATVDMDNAIDLWLFFKMTQASDNVYGKNVKNLLVSVKHSDAGVGTYKLLFAPWDLDYTYNYWQEPDADDPIYWTPLLYLSFYKDTEVIDQIKDKYNLLRQDVWSDENMCAVIDTYEAQIFDSGAFLRTQSAFADGAYQEADVGLDKFRERVLERLKFMDSLIENLSEDYFLQ